jgi:hypothetical protein
MRTHQLQFGKMASLVLKLMERKNAQHEIYDSCEYQKERIS